MNYDLFKQKQYTDSRYKCIFVCFFFQIFSFYFPIYLTICYTYNILCNNSSSESSVLFKCIFFRCFFFHVSRIIFSETGLHYEVNQWSFSWGRIDWGPILSRWIWHDTGPCPCTGRGSDGMLYDKLRTKCNYMYFTKLYFNLNKQL